MSESERELSETEVEATGETVGEAKWSALRELERRFPGIDKSTVSFAVLSEGERGLLGVGYAPARVIAKASAVPPPSEPVDEDPDSPPARLRELLDRVCAALGAPVRIEIHEDDEQLAATMKLQGASTPRPMTHDLLSEVLSKLEARVVKIAVTELRENTFYALITVAVNGSEIEIDSRPSDAIALAVRSDAPIFADDAVIEESAIEFEHEDDVNEEQMVEEFKKFLDDVKPDDFSAEA